jgi:spore maturation protein CgeB
MEKVIVEICCMKIDLFLNKVSQHNVLGAFTKSLHLEFERQAISSTIYDVSALSEGELLAALIKNRPDYTAGFNFFMGEHSYLEPLEIPHLAFVVDSATHYPSLLSSPHTLPCFVDQDSCEFLKFFGIDNALFFPHAIDRDLVSGQRQEEIVESKRDLDVVMTASFIDDESMYKKWQELFSKEAVTLLDDVVEKSLASPLYCHTLTYLQTLQQDERIVEEMKQKNVPIFDVVNSVEKVVRGRDKKRLIDALQSFPLHIFSTKKDLAGWKQAFSSHTNITYHEEVPFSQLFEVYKRAKIVINSMPTIKHGFHERLFYALAGGASVLTSKSFFLEERFPANKAVRFYLPPDYGQIKQEIETLRTCEKGRLDDVMALRKDINLHHTWDQRVASLLSCLR